MTHPKSIRIILAGLLLLSLSQKTPAKPNNPEEPVPFTPKGLHSELHPLIQTTPNEFSPKIKEYLDYYGLNSENADHSLGILSSNNFNIAVHTYKVEQPKGTVLVTHGLFCHSGIMKNLIHFLISQNFNVVSFDLPGHGISSGAPTAINDFEDYANSIKAAVDYMTIYFSGPFHFIGHSTSCSAAMEYMHENPDQPFDHVIFISPLVRSTQWGLAKFGYFMLSPFMKKVNRIYKPVSSDEAYLRFVKQDPLQVDQLSISFVQALFKWEKRIKKYPKIDQTVDIIQGDNDKIVNWKYNIPFLKNHLSQTEVTIIPGGNHDLMNELDPFKATAFEQIKTILTE